MSSNTYTKGYADGSSLTESQLDTAYQTLQLDIANTALATTGSTTGQALMSNGSGIAASFQTISDPMGPFALRNYGLKATVATGVLTISLKTKALATPSATDIVDFNYSTNGTTSASYSSVQVTAATTLTVNASATLGGVGTSAQAVYIYGYYNTSATAVKLAVSRRGDLDNGSSVSFTALSASADSAGIGYASATLTAMPRLLGNISIAQSSAGAWQTVSKTNIINCLPASIVDQNRAYTTSAAKVGQVVISGSSGSFSSSSTAFVSVTNMSVSITTTGRPVRLQVIGGYLGGGHSAGSGEIQVHFKFLRDGATSLGDSDLRTTSAANAQILVPASTMCWVDNVAAGTYTYVFQAKMQSAAVSSQRVSVNAAYLIASEM